MNLWDRFLRFWERKPARRPYRRLELECLEAREVPANIIPVTNTDDIAVAPPVNSLRWAVNQANTNGLDDNVIQFNIGNQFQTIALQASLVVTRPVTLDAVTQNGRTDQVIVLTRAGAMPNNQSGLHIKADPNQLGASGTVVKGLWVGGFGAAGILLDNVSSVEVSHVRVYGNHTGISITGTLSFGNSIHGSRIGETFGVPANRNTVSGVYIGSGASGNIIGGIGTQERNVISGNIVAGITIENSNHNKVRGNYIGTTTDGTAAGGAAQGTGVQVIGTSASNEIGMEVETILGVMGAPANLISGNTGLGVRIETSGHANQVSGNWIGTDRTGDQAIGNRLGGIVIAASHVTVGGPTAGFGNVISGNGVAPPGQPVGNGITIQPRFTPQRDVPLHQ